MSVLVTVKVQGDTASFRRALIDRAGEFEKIAVMARSSGGMHHRFGIGEGFVLIVDEWQTAEHFEQFFTDPQLQTFMGSVGADAAPPDITVTEAITSPDQY